MIQNACNLKPLLSFIILHLAPIKVRMHILHVKFNFAFLLRLEVVLHITITETIILKMCCGILTIFG